MSKLINRMREKVIAERKISMNESVLNALSPELKEFAKKLIKKGFRILVYTGSDYRPSFEKTTWLHFERNNRIFYVQHSSFGGGFDYSSEHKPTKKHGTGSRIKSMEVLSIDIALELTNGGYGSAYCIHSPFDGLTTAPQPWKNLEEFGYKSHLAKTLI